MINAKPLDPLTVTDLRRVMAQAQSGDLAGARDAGLRALALGRDPTAFNALLGMICCRMSEFAAAVGYLRTALRGDPEDITIALNLVTALSESGEGDAALDICTAALAERDQTMRLWRHRGYLLQRRDDFAGASTAYRRVVAAQPMDVESWNNLGNARAGAGDGDGSIAALRQAATLRPDSAPVRMNLAATLSATGRYDEAIATLEAIARDFPADPKPLVESGALMRLLGREAEARDALERAVEIAPNDADLQVKLGTERVLAWDMAEAETAYRAAIAIDPDLADAYVLLGVLLEQTNRHSHFSALIAAAERASIDAGAIDFLRALAFRRERRFEEGLATLARVPADMEPIRRAQMLGQFNDALGRTEAAFAAFAEMNALLAADPSEPLLRAAGLRAELAREAALVTPDWFGGWRTHVGHPSLPSPVFLVGFPRSGTTLLDTMLMGHPGVAVLEERPVLADVERSLGGWDRLPLIGEAELQELRAHYFEQASQLVDLRAETLLIDKSPLHMNKVPFIHRLFPDARFILALRHPCDVVLSCFITNFRLNTAMSNFLDLSTTATFYDQSFSLWESCRAIMQLAVHEVAYETMIDDPETTLRPLCAFLKLNWDAAILDHRRTAASRGVISTASYAQVTEPLYRRAAGRWKSYRNHLAPVLPDLSPWAERYGYQI